MTYQSINPATGRILKTCKNLRNRELDNKLQKSTDAYHFWRTSHLNLRSTILKKVADLLDNEKQNHAKVITLEMGKPIKQSLAEVEKCAWVCRYYAEKAKSFLRPISLESTARKSHVRFDPLGIILAIMPWNFPYWQVFRYLTPNFMAGNACLLKHASNVPQCAEAMEHLFLKAGAPEGVFQNLFIDYKQTEYVIRYPRVSGVTLTGSNYAGYKVAELAGRYGKKTVLELGGNDPFIVFESADLNKAVETGITARFQNTGQSCIAAKRFYIQNTVFDDFLKRFTDQVKKQKVGDPLNEDTTIGPIARKDLLLELEDQINRMTQQGGRIITGGKKKYPDTLYLEPTVIVDLPPDAQILQEELFGPIVPLFSFKDEKEVIQYSNQNPFGLGANVWTSDLNQAEEIARKLDTGTVAVNGMVKSEPNLPFGGVKASGYGRELSVFGIREFVNIKTVNIF